MTNAINTNDTTANTTAVAAARRLTRKAAIYRISVLETRIAKVAAAITVDQTELAALQEVLPTLPEVAEAAPGAVYAVGNVVNLTVGREANRRAVTGVVVGIALNEAGTQPARYKVEVGTGFDAEFHTVFPGSISGVVGAEGAEPAAEPSEDDALNAAGDDTDGYAAAAAFAAADGTQDF